MREPYKKSWVRDTFETLVVIGMTFVVQAFQIPTGSMENTLLMGIIQNTIQIGKKILDTHPYFMPLY